VTVGHAVRRAERIQRNLDGGEIGLDGATLELLPEDVQSLFEWRPGVQAHACADLDLNDIELALRAASYDEGETQSVTTTAAKVVVGVAGAALLGAVAKATASERRTGNDTADNGGGPGRDHSAGGEPGHREGHGGDVVPRRRWAG
jgi:hypothetical protein